MSSYLGMCLKLSGTQGPTGFNSLHVSFKLPLFSSRRFVFYFFSHFLRIVFNLFVYVLYLSSLCLDQDFRKYLYSNLCFVLQAFFSPLIIHGLLGSLLFTLLVTT